MDWEQVQNLVRRQIEYWRAAGQGDWAKALEQCLLKAERCQSVEYVNFDLRQRLARAERMG